MRHRYRRWREIWDHSAVGRLVGHGSEVELMHRSLGFAALGYVALLPLLVLVAALDPTGAHDFPQWVIDGMGLNARPARSVQDVFSTPHIVISTTNALSAAILVFFGLSFAASVQAGYSRIWGLSISPWHKLWRQTVWLTGLTAYLYVVANSSVVLRDGLWQGLARGALVLLLGLAFFWWGQSLLLGGKVPARQLLPGAVATMIGLVGLRWFSHWVFSPLVASNAVTYGPVGTVLIVVSWLVGVGYVVLGGTLLGRHVSSWLGHHHFRWHPTPRPWHQ
ncbi:YhjD/YihY/BrkB family envelope integrity protein [Streptomyces coeruleoprunus]|uniref:YhjD/YihY/BrkB family envelope integrity protein n=1 Tax=Streptomyces coeruleoprunus TaxID=285563 RepID=A0ABV9XIA0_9ACTN